VTPAAASALRVSVAQTVVFKITAQQRVIRVYCAIALAPLASSIALVPSQQAAERRLLALATANVTVAWAAQGAAYVRAASGGQTVVRRAPLHLLMASYAAVMDCAHPSLHSAAVPLVTPGLFARYYARVGTTQCAITAACAMTGVLALGPAPASTALEELPAKSAALV
jgi:hypothetical protein